MHRVLGECWYKEVIKLKSGEVDLLLQILRLLHFTHLLYSTILCLCHLNRVNEPSTATVHTVVQE